MHKILPVVQSPRCCGQTCVAMILGITELEAIELVGKKGLTNVGHLIKALRKKGIGCSRGLVKVYKHTVVPPNCIARVSWYRDGKRLGTSHWILYWDGVMYDPSGHEEDLRRLLATGTRAKVTSFLAIDPS